MVKYITLLTIIFFTATWCHYCQIMKPIVQELRTEGYDIVIKDNQFKKYNITKLPTLWVDGTKYPGARTIDQYREYMK